jgi:hypothetical protein
MRGKVQSLGCTEIHAVNRARLPLLSLLLLFSVVTLACGSNEPGEAGEQSSSVRLHHWRALKALEDGNVEDAVHHVEHVAQLVEGDHRDAMSRIVPDLQEGRLDIAQHEIERMLSGYVGPDLSEDQVHLQMALYSLSVDDLEEASHHVAHFMMGARGSNRAGAEAAIAELMEADRATGEELIRSLAADIIDADLPGEVCRADSAERGPDQQIQALVVFDREWSTDGEDQAMEDAMAVIEEANDALHEIGYHLDVRDYVVWDRPVGLSFDDVGHHAAQDLRSAAEEPLVVVLSGGYPDEQRDGLYLPSINSVVVRHDRSGGSAESTILIHEVGHLVGLEHRAGTYMQPHGFPLVPVWSTCQKSNS